MNPKNETQDNRQVTIYLPTGKEIQYTTCKTVADVDVHLVETIICDEHEVRIGYIDGTTVEALAYVGMPYTLSIWKDKK